MEDFPAHLEYTGIFRYDPGRDSSHPTSAHSFLSRYLNNPEVMSGASFLGLALISGSKLVGVLAIIRFLSFWWFLQTVEK